MKKLLMLSVMAGIFLSGCGGLGVLQKPDFSNIKNTPTVKLVGQEIVLPKDMVQQNLVLLNRHCENLPMKRLYKELKGGVPNNACSMNLGEYHFVIDTKIEPLNKSDYIDLIIDLNRQNGFEVIRSKKYATVNDFDINIVGLYVAGEGGLHDVR